jgi:hypothetical protein
VRPRGFGAPAGWGGGGERGRECEACEADIKLWIVLKKPPFLLQEQGWGEFDMELVLHAVDKGGDHFIKHDLNFHKNKYETVHTVVSSLLHVFFFVLLWALGVMSMVRL